MDQSRPAGRPASDVSHWPRPRKEASSGLEPTHDGLGFVRSLTTSAPRRRQAALLTNSATALPAGLPGWMARTHSSLTQRCYSGSSDGYGESFLDITRRHRRAHHRHRTAPPAWRGATRKLCCSCGRGRGQTRRALHEPRCAIQRYGSNQDSWKTAMISSTGIFSLSELFTRV